VGLESALKYGADALLYSFASHLSGLRAPPPEELKQAHAVLDAFLNGCDALARKEEELLESWVLVGSQTHKPPDLALLRQWRAMLAEQFPATNSFWQRYAAGFYQQVGAGYSAHYRLDVEQFSAWRLELLRGRNLFLAGLTALAVNEVVGKTDARIVALMPEEIVVELPQDFGKPEGLVAAIRSQVQEQLTGSFPGASFPFALPLTSSL
jgi:hypothetical protein